MTPENVTVVLPTRNEARNIAGFLATLPKSVELIVIDASDDETAEIVKRERPERTLIFRQRSNIAEARQLGAELARTEWLLFTDADVHFPESYFASLAGYETRCDVVYGAKLSRNGYARYYRGFALAQQASHRLGIPAATGSNLLVRRSVFAQVGGFDTSLVCNEDSELVWRIKRAGHRVVFAPDLPVYASDHRRLDLGLWRKTAHSVFRCLCLYFDLIPGRWRGRDWGYWSHLKENEETKTGY
ncbi:glycosyltransferase [Methylococcus sp. EFPC2]|uniref:glycosyltransferase n=1 Tax=Methylococcus sp. EFPC2 TaxID=2812648 RepID=UPI001967D7FA|nr:glycosyltransferase [Methylococcus sp. EFPC2]QSA98319.1 glycosyltransferase [Methylococcus sp. EFPC2]